MAKTSIRSKMTEEQINLMVECGNEICTTMREEPLEVEGIPRVACLRSDGQYRNTELLAGHNFFLVETYVGAKGQLIFKLLPEDLQEYELIEVGQDMMDEIFPLAGSILNKTLRFEKPQREDQASIDFEEDFNVITNLFIAKRANEKALEEELGITQYQENPNFGAF